MKKEKYQALNNFGLNAARKAAMSLNSRRH